MISKLPLNPKLVEMQKFDDSRGSFRVIQHIQRGLRSWNPIQTNIVKSFKGSLRGMHWQEYPKQQNKLIYCVQGAIVDVCVDLREMSLGKIVIHTFHLEANETEALFVPSHFAHGYLALSKETIVLYQVDQFYSPKHERQLNCLSHQLLDFWPKGRFRINSRDKMAPTIDEILGNDSQIKLSKK